MIQISEKAAKRISDLRQDDPSCTDDSFLRVKTTKGGCSGMSYHLEFDQKMDEKDRVFEQHGAKIVVDPGSFLYLIGMTLDFDGGLNGQGFVFSNPNATKTCGCGSSFAV